MNALTTPPTWVCLPESQLLSSKYTASSCPHWGPIQGCDCSSVGKVLWKFLDPFRRSFLKGYKYIALSTCGHYPVLTPIHHTPIHPSLLPLLICSIEGRDHLGRSPGTPGGRTPFLPSWCSLQCFFLAIRLPFHQTPRHFPVPLTGRKVLSTTHTGAPSWWFLEKITTSNVNFEEVFRHKRLHQAHLLLQRLCKIWMPSVCKKPLM